MVVANAVKNEKDKFGTERFAELKAQFKGIKLNKHFQNRLNAITAVFTYRCGVAYELHHIEHSDGDTGWGFRNKVGPARERLDSFKSVQFFLDAMQMLLVEVKEEAAALLKTKKQNPPSMWRD